MNDFSFSDFSQKTCKSQIFVAGKVLKSHANYLTNTFSHKLLKIS